MRPHTPKLRQNLKSWSTRCARTGEEPTAPHHKQTAEPPDSASRVLGNSMWKLFCKDGPPMRHARLTDRLSGRRLCQQMDIRTHRHPDRQTDRYSNRWTGVLTDKCSNTWIFRHNDQTHGQVFRQMFGQTDFQADGQTFRQRAILADGHAARQTLIETDWCSDRWVFRRMDRSSKRWTDIPTDGQWDRLTDIQTDGHSDSQIFRDKLSDKWIFWQLHIRQMKRLSDRWMFRLIDWTSNGLNPCDCTFGRFHRWTDVQTDSYFSRRVCQHMELLTDRCSDKRLFLQTDVQEDDRCSDKQMLGKMNRC